MNNKALNQILCAALVSKQFRNNLLNDANKTVRAGYLEHSFPLSDEEFHLVKNIQAKSIEDFAYQVYEWQLQNGHQSTPENPIYENSVFHRSAIEQPFQVSEPVIFVDDSALASGRI